MLIILLRCWFGRRWDTQGVCPIWRHLQIWFSAFLIINSPMASPTIHRNKTSFLSLPQEIRNEIYKLVLISNDESIYFDSTNGFMPAEKLVQEGIILMISRSSHRFIAREARQTFYQQSSFTLKSSDIPLLLDSEPFKHLEEGGFDPKEWIRRPAVYLDSEKFNPQCHPQNDPKSHLRSILGCTDLREVKVVIRGLHQATDAFCNQVIKNRRKPGSSSK